MIRSANGCAMCMSIRRLSFVGFRVNCAVYFGICISCMRLSPSLRSPDFSYERPISMSSEPMSIMAQIDKAVAVVAKAMAPDRMMMRLANTTLIRATNPIQNRVFPKAFITLNFMMEGNGGTLPQCVCIDFRLVSEWFC